MSRWSVPCVRSPWPNDDREPIRRKNAARSAYVAALCHSLACTPLPSAPTPVASRPAASCSPPTSVNLPLSTSSSICSPPNHGRVFKRFLHAYLPDWRDRERWLREEVGSNP